MKKTVLLLAAAALLMGCSHGMIRRPNAVVIAGAPQPTKGMDWRFAPVDDAAALTYGAAGGGGLKLVSGSAKSISAGAIQAAPGDANTQVLASKFNTMDPIIQAMSERGWISV